MGTNSYNLNSGMRCIKYILFIINLIFILTSILLMLVGTTIKTIYGDFIEFLDSAFLSPPTFVIAVGAIIFIVAIFGYFGAIKESALLINVYGLMLFVIFILEVSAAISGFVLQSDIRNMLTRTMNVTMHSYKQKEDSRKAVDFMQTALECCGINNVSDWQGILTPPDKVDDNNNNIIVPSSCCATNLDKCDHTYETGCLDRLNRIISQNAMLIATGAIAVALVQLLGVLCAFMLAKSIRHTKSIRELRRWQLRKNLNIFAPSENDIRDPEYTQLEKAKNMEKLSVPITYTASSPSVN